MRFVKLDISSLSKGQLKQMEEMEKTCGLEPFSRRMLLECVRDMDTFACLDADTIAGFITMHPTMRYLGGSLYMVNLNVAQAYRRKGIAQKLILTACSYYAATHTNWRVTLDVCKTNCAARSLYEKMGFCVTDQPSGNGDTDVVMATTLRSLLKISQTERLQLKLMTQLDISEGVQILQNEVVNKTYMLPDLTPEAAENLYDRLCSLSMQKDHFIRGIYLENKLIGFLNDTEITDSQIELGWVVHPDHHNRGYAAEAAKMAISELFARGFTEVVAGAFEDNPASIRVMEKCGMSRLEKTEEIDYRGAVHHCIFYSIKRTGVSLQTQRLILRNVRPEDATVMFDYRNNEICARYQRGQTKDLEGIKALVARRENDRIGTEENFLLAVEHRKTGSMVGEIVVMPNDGCFSIGYTFHHAHHRKGYAFEALSYLTDLLHERYPDMEFISFTEPENTASMALLRKLGYVDLGYEPKVESQVFGKWLKDEDWR